MRKPKLNLIGEDGNAFAIIGNAVRAAKEAGWSKEKIDAYRTKAMNGDYNNLIMVTLESFDVDFGYDGIDDDDLDAEMCERCENTLLFCTCEDDDDA